MPLVDANLLELELAFDGPRKSAANDGLPSGVGLSYCLRHELVRGQRGCTINFLVRACE